MCPTVSPSSWQPYFIYPPRVKIELHLPVLSALFTGHGAHRQACGAGDSSARQQAPTSGEEVQTVNMADELTVPRRGEPSPADSPPPLPPSLSHPVTDAVQSSLRRGAPRGPKTLTEPRGREGVCTRPRGPSGKCVRSLPTPRLLTARNAPVMVYKVVG